MDPSWECVLIHWGFPAGCHMLPPPQPAQVRLGHPAHCQTARRSLGATLGACRGPEGWAGKAVEIGKTWKNYGKLWEKLWKNWKSQDLTIKTMGKSGFYHPNYGKSQDVTIKTMGNPCDFHEDKW